MKNFISFTLILVAWLQTPLVYSQEIVGNSVNPYKYTSTKNKLVKQAAVASAHPLASAVGVAIMKEGGNAFDAAIATQFVLAVVYPGAGNLGGGGFLVAHTASKENFTIDYREKAATAASRDMYLNKNGDVLDDLSKLGHLAAGVPGTVAGLYATHQYAKLPWKSLVQPAIDIAAKGFAITEAEAINLNNHAEEFSRYSTLPTALVKKGGWKKDDILIQADLAKTLTLIRDNGRDGFYKGTTADLIVAEMQRGGGIISHQDLANYSAVDRQAITTTYRNDYTIISMPPPSSGGTMLVQMLNMLETKNIKAIPYNSAAYVNLVAEVERLAYTDRAVHLGDMDYYKVPLQTLTSKAYASNRVASIVAGKAGQSKQTKAGNITESEETTHLSVVDAEGNCIAVTTTLNGSYGCKTVVGNAGFLLNNEMDDFSVKPGVANMYGAVGGEANKIVPNKRMLSSMTPTIVLKKGKPFIVCGTPGGTTIITSVLQTILNIVDYNQSAKDAVNNPKFHHQWLPDQIFVEKTFDKKVIATLKDMGYFITERGAIGRTEVIKINGKNNIEVAADTRGDDSAAGY
jgi:gamma-glutamyltranspeptidase/glutathione hydrolase